MKIFFTAEYDPKELKPLYEFGEVVIDGWALGRPNLTQEELLERSADADIIITTFDEITRAVIENAKNLKLIACTRATPVNVDMAAAKERGIPPICDDQVQILGGDIKCAAYTYPGTPEMAETVLEALDERNGALIANHGSIAIGRTIIIELFDVLFISFN